MEQNKHSQQLLQAGPLKSTLTLKLHTSYAIRLWEGRVVPNSQNDGDEKKRKWMIPSLPMFISRAGHITDDAKKGYLYAEMWLYQLEQALEQGTQTIQKLLSEVEQQLVQLTAIEQRGGRLLAALAPADIRQLEQVQLLPVGGRYQGWEMTDIQTDRVTLRYQGRTVTLRLP